MSDTNWGAFNVGPCTGELVISPHYCTPGPTHDVPITGTLPLMLLGVVVMIKLRRRSK